MRGAVLLLLLAVAAAAADPFTPSRDDLAVDDATYARYVETLAILKESLDRDPAGSLERALDILEQFGIGERLEETIAKALAAAKEEGPTRGTLLSLSAYLTVQQAEGTANVWVFGPNGTVHREGLDDQTKKMVATAVDMLREAIRLCPKDPRAKETLASALDLLDSEKNAEEVNRLRTEAAILRIGAVEPPEQTEQPKPVEDDAARIRREAEALEQKETDPDHAKALLLRKEALVRDFCAHTIPVEYDAALYGTVSLLAPEDLIQTNLTRTYLKKDGSVDSVPPSYHPAKLAQRIRLIEGLGQQQGAAAGAVLLKLLATANVRDAVTAAAMKALLAVPREDVRRHLPALLAECVCHDQFFGLGAELRALRQQMRALGVNDLPLEGAWGYGPVGQALLVEAAVALKVREAAPVLAVLLPAEDDLSWPRGIAAAIGALGGPEQADALLAVARNPARDIYFRREAVLALGRIAPARLSEVPLEPHLEIALAAARYRAEPSEALKGRLLQGISQPHEVDDAARYMMDLGIPEAIPEIERFLEEHPDHYAAPILRALKTSS